MGASDSKLAFRTGVFRLVEEENIPFDEDAYWDAFHLLPDSALEIFQLVSVVDVTVPLQKQPKNMANLVRKLSAVVLQISSLEVALTRAQIKSLLNCLRILTRIMPFVFELGSGSSFEEEVFWTVTVQPTDRVNHPEKRLDPKTPEAFMSPVAENEPLAPLAERLIRALVNLLFFPGFTLPALAPADDKRIRYIIWTAGVGATNAPASSGEIDSYRTETLKCLLVMLSKSMYVAPQDLVHVTNPWLRFAVTQLDKPAVLAILCCCLNVVLSYNPAGWVPYDHVVFRDSRESLVQVAAESLVVLLGYSQGLVHTDSAESAEASGDPVPQGSIDQIVPREEAAQSDTNKFRFYLSKLHRASDFQIILDGLCTLLTNPIQAQNTYLPYSMKNLNFFEEVMMVFWKLIEINKKFFAFACQNEKILGITSAIVFQALSSKNNMARVGLLRMCSYVLHYLSCERSYVVLLNRPYSETFHTQLGVPHFRGNYADLIVLSLHTLIFSSKGKLVDFYETFLTIIANLSPYIKSFSVVSSNKLLQMFTSFSSAGFILGSQTNHILTFFMLDTFNNILQYQFDGNPHLVYEVLRHSDKFRALNEMTFESGSAALHNIRERRRLAIQAKSSAGTTPTAELANLNLKAQQNNENSEEVTQSEPVSPLDSSMNGDQELPTQAATAPVSPMRGSSADQEADRDPTLFQPTHEWFNFWHDQLPLATIMSLIEKLAPQVEQLCEQNNWTDEAVLEYLQSGTLVGLLPVPHPIFVRRFQFLEGTYVWFTSYVWGVIYLRHVAPLPTIWMGSKVKLFLVKTVDN